MKRFAPLLVFFGTAAVFLPALWGDFLTVDDGAMVWKNPGVLQGLGVPGLKWAFTTWYWGMWHPLTWVSHQLDVSLFGLAPWGHHLTSVVLHALATALAFAWLRGATGRTARSLLVALLFGLHPLRAESVAWVAERKDVLCTLFSVLALWLHLRYRRAPNAGRWLLVTLAVALALLSKPSAVTLPFVLLLTDAWPSTPAGQSPGWRTRVLEKLPWVALALGASVLTVLYQRAGGAVSDAPLGDRLPRALAACGLNLWHTVWPVHLSYLYPRSDPGAAVLVLSGLAVAALLVTAWRSRRARPSWAVGVLWFFVATLPTLGLLQVGAQLTADRYTYFAHLGLFAGLVFALPEVPERWRRAAGLLGAAAVTACAGLLWGQLSVWGSSEALFAQALARDPDNVMALHSLALLQAQGDQLEEGLKTYRRALALTPNDAFIRSNYARALLRAGQVEEAVAEAARAHQRKPSDAYSSGVYADALTAAGRCAEAVPLLTPLQASPPEGVPVELDLGSCLVRLGRADEAWPHFERARARAPGDAGLAVFVAGLALEARRPEVARRWLEEAAKLNPEDARVGALRAQLEAADAGAVVAPREDAGAGTKDAGSAEAADGGSGEADAGSRDGGGGGAR